MSTSHLFTHPGPPFPSSELSGGVLAFPGVLAPSMLTQPPGSGDPLAANNPGTLHSLCLVAHLPAQDLHGEKGVGHWGLVCPLLALQWVEGWHRAVC